MIWFIFKQFILACDFFVNQTKALNFNQNLILIFIPLRFRKAGRVLCGGARETHSATSHNIVTPRKTEEFLKSSCFFDLNGRIFVYF